jgi:hypothetical protein
MGWRGVIGLDNVQRFWRLRDGMPAAAKASALTVCHARQSAGGRPAQD